MAGKEGKKERAPEREKRALYAGDTSIPFSILPEDISRNRGVESSKNSKSQIVMVPIDAGSAAGKALLKRAARYAELKKSIGLDFYDEFASPEGKQPERGVTQHGPTDKRFPIEPNDPRLGALDRFTKENPGQPISEQVLALFAVPHHGQANAAANKASAKQAIEAPPLPKRAPERWPTDPDKRKETPPEFVVRVYGPWMAAGVLTRPYLKQLDPLLFGSLDNWLKNNNRRDKPLPLPDGYNLKSSKEKNSEWVARVQSGQEPMPTEPAELARYAMALRYRLQPDRGR